MQLRFGKVSKAAALLNKKHCLSPQEITVLCFPEYLGTRINVLCLMIRNTLWPEREAANKMCNCLKSVVLIVTAAAALVQYS